MAVKGNTTGLRRSIRDLVVDLNSIEESLHPAVEKVIEGTAVQVLSNAQRSTPVLTGFMRSRWRNDKRGDMHWSVSNDTWYLPKVNQASRHLGFADKIAEEAADILTDNLKRLHFSTSFRKGGVNLEYTEEQMGILMEAQEPIKRAEFVGVR